MKKFATCLFVSLLCISPLHSQSWEYWGQYKTKKVYINPKLTQKFGQIIQITTKDGKGKKALIGRTAFDCKNKGIMQINAKNAKQTWQSWENFYTIKPNTYGEWLYKKACNL